MEVQRLSTFVRDSFGATRDDNTGEIIGYYSDESSHDPEEAKSLADEAEAAEEMLGEVLSIASARTGSLLSLQSAPKLKALEMGRQASLLSINYEDDDDNQSVRSYRSATGRNVRSADPVFIKAPKGDPTVLTQKSWDAIVEMENKPEMGHSKLRSVMSEKELASLKARKWDKLRNDLKNQNEDSGNFFTRGLKKTFGALKRKSKPHPDDGNAEGALASTPRTLAPSPSEDSEDSSRSGESTDSSKSRDSTDSSHTKDATNSSRSKDPADAENSQGLGAAVIRKGAVDPPESTGHEVPLKSTVPEVPLKSTVPEVPLKSTVPEVSLKSTVPAVAPGVAAQSKRLVNPFRRRGAVDPPQDRGLADPVPASDDATDEAEWPDEGCESHLICVDNHRIMVETRQGQEPTPLTELPEPSPEPMEEEESTEVVYSGCGVGDCISNPCAILPSFGSKAT
jgi:hypothetical protein